MTKHTYRITEGNPDGSAVRTYDVEAVAHDIQDGLVVFLDRGLKLALSTHRVHRIEMIR